MTESEVFSMFRFLDGQAFYLVTLTFHENSNHGWENYWVCIPVLEVQKKICPFSVHFQILHEKLHIFVFNHF